MDRLIPIFNRLQQVIDAANDGCLDPSRRLTSVSVELPTIVVIGSQSSGKSSVLEGLVGRDFLPRGKDIVTRRPLVLQLYHISEAEGPDYAVFGHRPEHKLTDFALVKREIEHDTERVAGRGKAISTQPIQLAIYSSRLLPLKLVDLPGITKIPVGDQPADIEQQIRALVLEYACRPNALLLAVTPANQDLANSDALKIVGEVDPAGQRSIGVLTKLDLMDAGTNALEILQNRASVRLRHGFVGVVLRSQQDIQHGMPIREAIAKEAAFFKAHLHYRKLSGRWGMGFLASELNKILLQHIKASLPDIRSTVNNILLTCQAELLSYGGEHLGEKRQQLLLRLVTLYVTDFQEAIQGTSKSLHALPADDELTGGAKLSLIFHDEYGRTVDQMDAADDLSLEQVRLSIRNSSGPRPAIFIPEGSFEALVRSQICRLERPAVKCVEAVYDELHRLLSRTSRIELKRFPKLTLKMIDAATALLKERLQPTFEMVDNLIKIEQAYINTNHPDFMSAEPAFHSVAKMIEEKRRQEIQLRMSSGSLSDDGVPMLPIASPPTPTQAAKDGGLLSYLFKASPSPLPAETSRQTPTAKRRVVQPSPHPHPPNPPNPHPQVTQPQHHQEHCLTEREEFETQLIMTLLHGYFAVVKRNVLDSVPKACMHFLVNHVMEQLPSRLVSELYKEELFAELLTEDESMVNQRQRCRRELDALQEALGILGGLRDDV